MRTRFHAWIHGFLSVSMRAFRPESGSAPAGYPMPVIVLVFLGFVAISTSGAGLKMERPYRLAVISDEPALRNFAGLLTAELSSKPELELLERSEIDRVLAEQEATLGLAGAVHAGRILGAEGLVLLNTSTETSGKALILRFVSVGPGIHLGTTRILWPTSDLPAWASWAVEQQLGLLPKLRISGERAVPISVVGLRSAVQAPDAAQIEAALTEIMIDRLASRPEFFVLERRRLRLLGDEKEVANDDAANFWSGRCLLDGLIDRDGRDPNRLTIHAVLKPFGGGAGERFEASGSRTNIAEAVEKLCADVARSLRPEARAPAMDSNAEAKRYAGEGDWARRWGLVSKAESAYDAAWWLGLQTPEIAEKRIRCAQSLGSDLAGCSYTRGGSLVRFTAPPNNGAFAGYLRAVSLYEGLRETLGSKEGVLSDTWFSLGVELLEGVSTWLRHYYFMTEARLGEEERIISARGLAVRLSDILTTSENAVSPTLRTKLVGVKARWGGLWYPTPEEGVRVFKELAASGDLPIVRKRFLNIADFEQPPLVTSRLLNGGLASDRLDPASPCLAGWRWEDRRRCPEVWNQFVDSLCASTNRQLQFEGRYIRCSGHWSTVEYQADLALLLQFAETNAESLTEADPSAMLLKDLKELVDVRYYFVPDDAKQRIMEELWKPFVPRFKAQQERARSSLRQRESERQREAFRNRVSSTQRPQAPATNLSAPLVVRSNVVLTPAVPPAVVQRLQQGPRIRRWNITPSDTNRLVVDRFWAIPGWSSEGSSFYRPTVEAICERDGRIWAEVRGDQKGTSLNLAERDISCTIYSIDPVSFTSRAIRMTDSDAVTEVAAARWAHGSAGSEAIRPGVSYGGGYGHRIWDIHAGRLYAGLLGGLQRHDPATDSWEKLPVTHNGYGRVMSSRGRLFVSTRDSILEATEDGRRGIVLASTRRRPSTTTMDELATLDWPAVWVDSNNRLLAMVWNNLYRWDSVSHDWELMAAPTNGNRGIDFAAFQTKHGIQQRRSFLLSDSGGGLDIIESSSRSWPANSQLAVPLWSLPIGMDEFPESSGYLNGRVWCVAGLPSVGFNPLFARNRTGTTNVVLVGFDRSNASAMTVGLFFIGPKPPPQNVMPISSDPLTAVLPSGLAIATRGASGFWLVPQDHLNRIADRNRGRDADTPEKAKSDSP
jgi:hypothetical protein